MKKILMALLMACGISFIACSDNAPKQETNILSEEDKQTESAVVRAFGMNPPLTVLLEILNPEGMIGLNYKPYPEDLVFMPPNIATLPVLGHMGDRSAQFEAITSLKPDVVFFTDSTPLEVLEPYEKVGIKAVSVEGYGFESLGKVIESYKDALGGADSAVGQKADALIAFVQKSISTLQTLQGSVTHRPKIYFAQGFDGLKSQCSDENNEQELAYQIGGVNALPCSILTNPAHQVTINVEILASIDPEVIFVRELPFYKELMTNPSPEWQSLQALKNHRIYYAPSTPSNWLMRPPSVMQSIGFLRAFAKVQPELLSDEEVKVEAQHFFHTFLRDLSDEDYECIQGLRD